MRTTMKKLIIAFLLLSAALPAAGSAYAAPLYFPHIATIDGWQTEIAIVNTGSQTISGALKAYSNTGQPVDTQEVTLSGHGRRQIDVATEFTNHTAIGYIIFDTDSDRGPGLHEVLPGRGLSDGNPCGQRGQHLGHLYLRTSPRMPTGGPGSAW